MGKRARKSLKAAVATRRLREALSERLVETAGALERPAPSPEVVGELHHFLERTERLSDEARELAMRLYYDVAMARHVALLAQGLLPTDFSFGPVPAAKAEGRVVLDLEPGESPGRLVLDGRGLLVTCLAPEMTVEWGTPVSHARLLALLDEHAGWLETQRTARKVAADVDLAELVLRVEQLGWSTPRELVQALVDAGPAAVPIARSECHEAIRRYLRAYAAACDTSGPRTDGAVRAWLHWVGAYAAWLLILAEHDAGPAPRALLPTFWVSDPVAAMVLGAASTAWPKELHQSVIGEALRSSGGPRTPDPAMAMLAVIVADSVDLRFLPEEPPEPDPVRGLDPESMASARATLKEALERHRRGYAMAAEREGLSGLHGQYFGFVRDLAILGLGGRPDWGDDLVEDPFALPPPSAVELCPPGGGLALRPLRHLFQRLLAALSEEPIAFFWTGEELRSWARARPLPRVRSGRFLPPLVSKASPVRADKVPRNAPCPCGSGKKHKHCCLGKPSGADPE